MRIVEYVHRELAERIVAGDLGIDATVGNGYDTLFLVQKGAQVIGFDVQEAAIQITKNRLREAGLEDRAQLQLLGHQNMLEGIPNSWIREVKIVMFNLGYLPGSDKSVITVKENTLRGVDSALEVLKKGGLLSIVFYLDHPGGLEESQAVIRWARELTTACVNHYKPNLVGPQWLLIERL